VLVENLPWRRAVASCHRSHAVLHLEQNCAVTEALLNYLPELLGPFKDFVLYLEQSGSSTIVHFVGRTTVRFTMAHSPRPGTHWNAAWAGGL